MAPSWDRTTITPILAERSPPAPSRTRIHRKRAEKTARMEKRILFAQREAGARPRLVVNRKHKGRSAHPYVIHRNGPATRVGRSLDFPHSSRPRGPRVEEVCGPGQKIEGAVQLYCRPGQPTGESRATRWTDQTGGLPGHRDLSEGPQAPKEPAVSGRDLPAPSSCASDKSRRSARLGPHQIKERVAGMGRKHTFSRTRSSRSHAGRLLEACDPLIRRATHVTHGHPPRNQRHGGKALSPYSCSFCLNTQYLLAAEK